jgi:hypothetical protein
MSSEIIFPEDTSTAFAISTYFHDEENQPLFTTIRPSQAITSR